MSYFLKIFLSIRVIVKRFFMFLEYFFYFCKIKRHHEGTEKRGSQQKKSNSKNSTLNFPTRKSKTLRQHVHKALLLPFRA